MSASGRLAGWAGGRQAGWLARTQALLAGARRLPPGTCLLCSRAEAAAAARAYSGFFFPILIDGAGKPKGGACSGRGGPADTAARPPACQPGTPAYARARVLIGCASPSPPFALAARPASHPPGAGGAPHAEAASCLPGLVRGTMSGTRREPAACSGPGPRGPRTAGRRPRRDADPPGGRGPRGPAPRPRRRARRRGTAARRRSPPASPRRAVRLCPGGRRAGTALF